MIVSDLILNKQKIVNFALLIKQVQREATSGFSNEHQQKHALDLICEVNNRLDDIMIDLNKWYWNGSYK